MMMLTHSIAVTRSQLSRSEVGGRDRLARERRGRAGERDAALLQAIDVVCRLERLHDVLLDDDERTAFGDDRGQAGIDLAHHDRRETETDLVAEQKFRVGHQRAADRDHLLLAARERGARDMAALGQRREQLVDPRQAPRPRPTKLAADDEVLLDRERGEQPPPSGTSAMPRATTAWAGSSPIGSPSKTTASRRDAITPAMHLSSVDLPAPLAPMTATTSPGCARSDTPNSAWKSP